MAHNPSLLSLPDSMGPTYEVPGETGAWAPHSAIQKDQVGWKNSRLRARAVETAVLAEQTWQGCPGQPELGKATMRPLSYWVLYTPTLFHRHVGSFPTSCPAGQLLPKESTPASDLRGNTSSSSGSGSFDSSDGTKRGFEGVLVWEHRWRWC